MAARRSLRRASLVLLALATGLLATPALVAGREPTPPDAGDGRHWQLAATLGKGWVLDLTDFGSGLAAVGRSHDRGSVWLSSDSRHWEEQPLRLAPQTVMTSVVAAGPGLVAGGAASERWVRTDDPPGTPRIWWSREGRRWHEAQLPADYRFGRVNALITTSDGILAVGWADIGDGARPHVWRSADGITWADASIGPTAGTTGELWGIASNGTTLIAVGGDAAGHRVWRSEDGREWGVVATAFPDMSSRWESIIWTGAQWVSGESSMGPWTSSDGTNWTDQRQANPLLGFVWTGDVLVGYRGDWGVVATSADGTKWHPLVDQVAFEFAPGVPKAFEIDTATATRHGVIAASIDGFGGDIRIWRAGTSLPPTSTSAITPSEQTSPSILILLAVVMAVGAIDVAWRRRRAGVEGQNVASREAMPSGR